MPFCYAPWSNVDIHPQGTVSPCCKFKHQFYTDKALNINSHNLDEYKQSRTLAIVKQDFRNNVWPLGCGRCKIDEENGLESKRQLDWIRWHEYYEIYELDQEHTLTASIAFGNTCNLSCVTCNAFASSRWQKEHEQIYGEKILPNHFYKHGFVEEFIDLTPDLVHLDIPGGEPFLSGVTQQQQLLQDLVIKGRAQDIALHYTTNCTIWPDESWWNLWKNFKEIDIQLSLDAIGSRLEYIRHPANWQMVVANVHRYQSAAAEFSNVKLSISHTVSAYNIFYMPEFIDWCSTQSLPPPWCGRVHNPVHMRPSVWPESVRQHIIQVLAQHTDPVLSGFIQLMESTDDSEHFDRFRQVTSVLDLNRGLDFCLAFPDLAAWYKS